MRKKLKSRWITIVWIFGICGICGLGLVLKWLFWEPDGPAKSPFDETFVSSNKEAIYCKSSDISELQSEILQYAKSWKDIGPLRYVEIYLKYVEDDLDVTGANFSYELNDIENYSGWLLVMCNKEDGNWKIWRAISEYVDFELPNDHKTLRDMILPEKIQAVVSYIELKDEPRYDIYRVYISENKIDIDAYNVESGDTSKYWHEYCTIRQEGNQMFLEPRE